MLDIILDSLGVALLLGQAIYFWIFAEASIGAMPSGRSVFPATGDVTGAGGEAGRD